MLKVDGITYYDTVEMCYAVKCSASTINSWYAWRKKQTDKTIPQLPKPHKFSTKNYFTASEIEQIKTFKITRRHYLKEKKHG